MHIKLYDFWDNSQKQNRKLMTKLVNSRLDMVNHIKDEIRVITYVIYTLSKHILVKGQRT